MIEQIILIVHVLIAIAIIGLILIQQGKGADMGASFGGGGSQTLFGPSGGGNVLTKATAILATLFFVSSFGLAIIAKQKAVEVRTDTGLQGLEEAAAQIEEAREQEVVIPTDDEIPLDILEQEAPADLVDEIPQ